jgi:EthD domain
MTGTSAIKQLSLVRRAPTIETTRFAAHWRDSTLRIHAALPASQRPVRLAHCVARRGKSAPLYDGVAIAWFDTVATMTAYHQSVGALTQSRAEVALDDTATLNVLVEERCVFGPEGLDALWHLQHGANALLLIGLLQKASQLSRVEFRDYWWQQHRPLANRLMPPELQPPVYVHNYVLSNEHPEWDGIGELYESSLDNARQRNHWMTSEAAAALITDETRFLNRATRAVLVTDFEVLTNQPFSAFKNSA